MFAFKKPLPQHKSLLSGIEYPPGFDKNGRRVLAKCPEFRLVELFKVGGETVLETAPKIERAYWQALFRINQSCEKGDTDQRISWAIALKKMMQFKKRGYTGSDVPLAKALSETLGPAIEKALSSQDVNAEVAKVARMFRDAVLAQAREANMLKDQRAKKHAVPVVAVLIWEAQGSFQHYRKRPKKSYLQERLEMIGYGIKKKASSADWRDLFEQASLDRLPA